ncbi:MAG: antitoxin VbhA family protein [Oscillospiraceae bacterium]|nr:antitoxin VbhA family protein [Oscillospiraceae bacterium]
MSEQERQKRIAAVKTADAVNAIEGASVSGYARDLSIQWANGELTDDEMLEALWAAQQERLAQR